MTQGEAAPAARPEKVAIYVSVQSPAHREHLERQAARGYQVAQAQVGTEIASGVTDRRPTLLALLTDTSVTRSVVEHPDRLTRFGFPSLGALLEAQGRSIDVVHLAENDSENEDLMAVWWRSSPR